MFACVHKNMLFETLPIDMNSAQISFSYWFIEPDVFDKQTAVIIF